MGDPRGQVLAFEYAARPTGLVLPVDHLHEALGKIVGPASLTQNPEPPARFQFMSQKGWMELGQDPRQGGSLPSLT